MNRSFNTKKTILAAFFAALTAVLSIVSFPLPFSPVPINFALLSVLLSGTLLGPRFGALSQLVYVLIGAAGLPVFHSMTGGLSILAGPTGGYLAGYIAAAFVAGSISAPGGAPFSHASSFPAPRLLGPLLGVLACYLLGTLWFMYITEASLATALVLCVIPFLPGDGIKIALTLFLTRRLRPLV